MDTSDLIVIGGVVLFIISSIQALRLFRFTRLKQYGVFSVIFILMSIDTYLIYLGQNNNFVENLVTVSYICLLHLILQEINPTRVRSWSYFSSIFAILILSFLSSYLIFELVYDGSTALRLLIIDLFVVFIGLEHFLEFRSLDLLYDKRKLRLGKRLWVGIGLLFVIFGIIRSVVFLFNLLSDQYGIDLPDWDQATFPLLVFIYICLALFMVLTINLLPEMYLMHRPYINAVIKLYKLSEQESTGGIFSEFDSIERLKVYLEEISEENQGFEEDTALK
jgi:hypothetical protein